MNKTNFKFEDSNDFKDKFSTLTGFVFKKANSSFFVANSDNTWIHYGNPQNYLYSCNSTDDCKENSVNFNSLEANHLYFTAVHIEHPDSEKTFKFSESYKNFNNIYGFRCISDKISLKFTENFNAWRLTRYDNLISARSVFNHNEYYHNFHKGTETKRFRVYKSGKYHFYVLKDSNQYNLFSTSYVFSQNGKNIEVTYKKESIEQWNLSINPTITIQRKNNSSFQSTDSLDFGKELTFDGKMFRNAALFYVKFYQRNYVFNGFEDDLKLIKYVGNPCEGEKSANLTKPVTYTKWMGNERIAVVVTFKHSYEELKVSVGETSDDLKIYRKSTTPRDLVIDKTTFFGVEDQLSVFRLAVRDSDGFFISASPTYKYKRKGHSLEMQVNPTKLNEIEGTDGDSITSCYRFSGTYTHEGLHEANFSAETITLKEKFAVLKPNSVCNQSSFFDLDTNRCTSSCMKIKEDRLCYKNCDGGCMSSDLSICPGEFKFVQNKTKCVAECAPAEFINEGKECVSACPVGKLRSGRECIDECTVLEEDGICVDSCSTGKYILDKKCVSDCPEAKSKINNGVCVASCGVNQKIVNEKECIADCPSSTPYLQSQMCVANCGSNYFLEGSTCVTQCGTGFFKNTSTKRCSQICPQFYDGNQCVSNCNGKLKQGTHCVSSCSNGFLEEGNECVDKCSSTKVKEGNKCLTQCSSILKNQDKICVSSCSTNKLEESHGSETKCVDNCSATNNFIENNKCVAECTSSTGVDMPSTCKPNEIDCNGDFSSRIRECLSECPVGLKKQIKSAATRGICVKECSTNFVLRKNGECHETCEGTEVIQNGVCVDECADQLVEDSGKCVFKCSSAKPYVQDRKCVVRCANQGKVEEGTCVTNCSESLFAESDSASQIHCVKACKPTFYKILSNRRCVSTCVNTADNTDLDNPFLYADENRNCVKECPVGIYNNTCTDSCCSVNNCANPFIGRDKTCLSECPEGEFIFEGKCLVACPQRMVVLDERICVRTCPRFKIGVNCVEKCDGFVVLNPDAMEGECVKECPTTLPFYYQDNKICLSECPFYNGKNKECLNNCSGFIDTRGSHLHCKERCTDPRQFNKRTERTICASKDKEKGMAVKINRFDYNIPLNCLDLLKNHSELTDENCKTKCRDEQAYSVKLTENECVSECPKDQPYFYNNRCEESCPVFYTLHNECMLKCENDTPFTQTIEDKEYCLFECQDGWLPSRMGTCYNPAKIDCKKPTIQVEDSCESCDFGLVYEEGKCVVDCSACFDLSLEGTCEKCNGVKFRGKCQQICPSGYSPDPEGPSCAPVCRSCAELKMFESNGKCVSKCPERQFARNNKCTSCTEVNTFANPEEERICGSCKEKFKAEDGSCIEQCNLHSFTKEGEHFCVDCLGAFFYKDSCVASCPSDTVTYYHKKECLPLPRNCGADAHLCKRESTCVVGSNGPKCVCKSNTKGLLCQVLVDQVQEENDIQIVKSWNNTTELKPTVLENAMKLVGNKIEEPELLDSIDKLAKEAFVEAKRDNFFVLADFSLKETSFEDQTKAKNRRQEMIKEITEISSPNSRRLLQSDGKYFEYDGENYAVVYTKELGDRANLDECSAKLSEQLNMPQAAFEYQYIQLNGSLALNAPEVTKSQLQLNSEPFVTVSIYVDGKSQDISEACSLESVDVEYDVPPKANTELLEKMQGKGVNPFDQQDEYFTDICSLKNSGSDITLSKRKKDNFVDPAKECNQKEGQICTITAFSAEEVKCKCIGVANNPPSLNESFLTTFTESNFRLVKCYNKAFTRKITKNPGFVLSFSVFIFFYILQNLSLIYTLKRLKGKHFRKFIANSMLVLGEKELSLKEYFSKTTSIQIQSPTTVPLDKKLDRSGEVSSIRELKEQSKLEIEAENQAKLENELKLVGPTVMDYDSLTLEEQIEWDKRSFWGIFKVQTLRNHSYLNAFCFDFLLVPMHIRLFFLMTIILVAMSLNAFFYTEALIDSRAEAKDAVLA